MNLLLIIFIPLCVEYIFSPRIQITRGKAVYLFFTDVTKNHYRRNSIKLFQF
jgi:hypothetical protein